MQTGVPCRFSADRLWFNISRFGVCFQFAEYVVMRIHSKDSANWHSQRQVPNDTLNKKDHRGLSAAMAHDFRHALVWHMDNEGTSITDLVSATGVSRDVINKLRARPESSTTVENAMLIAAYYGKTVNQFISLEQTDSDDAARSLIELLTPEERRLLEAQMRGLIAARDEK